MNSFIVSVRGDRLNASYNVSTVAEAISKAASLAELGVVTITDPLDKEYASEQFEQLRIHWRG